MRPLTALLLVMLVETANAQTVGPQPVNAESVLGALPTGAVLLFEKLPDPVPSGWKSCGKVRLDTIGKPATTVECLRKGN